MNIFLICGHAGHGKDTVCDEILSQDSSAHRLALADPLKIQSMELWKDDEAFHVDFSPQGKISYKVPKEHFSERGLPDYRRAFWQIWGTQGRRSIDPLWWCKEWCYRSLLLQHQNHQMIETFVIPDGRFLNEFAFFKQLGALTIFVDRGDFRLPGVDYDHPSEKEVEVLKDHCTYVIDNTGSLSKLRNQVRTILDDC